MKKGDNVIVRKGKNKGKTGKIERLVGEERVVITGINLYKKHGKPTKKNPKGGIIDVAVPMRMENVRVVCPSCSKATRVGFKMLKKRKFRVCKKCKAEIASNK